MQIKSSIWRQFSLPFFFQFRIPSQYMSYGHLRFSIQPDPWVPTTYGLWKQDLYTNLMKFHFNSIQFRIPSQKHHMDPSRFSHDTDSWVPSQYGLWKPGSFRNIICSRKSEIDFISPPIRFTPRPLFSFPPNSISLNSNSPISFPPICYPTTIC